MPNTPDPLREAVVEPEPLDSADVPMSVAQLAELGILKASLLHELRQPLFAIRASAQLALAGGEDGMRSAFRRIIAQTDHLEELVEFYGGRGLPAEQRPFDLNEPVRQGVEMLGHRCRSSGAHLVVDLAREPLMIRGRPGAAKQVVVNLLHNAFDAVTRDGEPGAVRRVAVRTRAAGDDVVLIVEDSGPGMDAQVLERVFEALASDEER